MPGFQSIIGHEEIIKHLKSALQTGKISHSYIFSGDRGSGKKTIANAFAMALQCDVNEVEPCQKCESCKRAIGRNHPDIITVTHEKPDTISIDEIREQLVYDVSIKPYYNKYKIYIVPDAEKMTPQAQNAILKTIEEPPEYAVIMLLTGNVDALLPTIQSRCIRMDLKVVPDQLVKQYLMEHLHIPDYQAELDVSFAQGSIGKAESVATSEEFNEITRNALSILKSVDSIETFELVERTQNISAEKQNYNDYLDLFLFWFRDVLMYKATREYDNLVYKQEIKYISEQAKMFSYEHIETILAAIEKTKTRLRANVNPETALELLFMTIREK
ncbi:MAG: DNA polymerase III subunit delta' [Eubacteriales bacterium]|nr:DNA polymerase III subunit delta' [Eubacteriales bacterium]